VSGCDASRIRRIKVFLDGKPIKRTTRRRFFVRIRAERVRAGRHTIRVVARDRVGNRTVQTLSVAGRSLCARMRTGSRAAAGVRAVGQAGLEFAEVDVAPEEAFACVEQAGEDAGADQAEYGFAEAEADPRGGEEEAEQGGELSGGHVS
jgi:hypothetical protein